MLAELPRFGTTLGIEEDGQTSMESLVDPVKMSLADDHSIRPQVEQLLDQRCKLPSTVPSKGTVVGTLPCAECPPLPIRPERRRRGQLAQKILLKDIMAQIKAGHSLKEAAGHLQVCATILKKACRLNGIAAWPSKLKRLQAVNGVFSTPPVDRSGDVNSTSMSLPALNIQEHFTSSEPRDLPRENYVLPGEYLTMSDINGLGGSFFYDDLEKIDEVGDIDWSDASGRQLQLAY